MKKAALTLAMIAAFGLAACNGQQDEGGGQPDGVPGGAGVESPMGTGAGAAPGTAPGTTDPAMAPGDAGVVGPGTVQFDTLGQRGADTVPNTGVPRRP
jgi:hypothetical protein